MMGVNSMSGCTYTGSFQLIQGLFTTKKPASNEAGCGVFRVKWYKFSFSLFDLNQLNNFSAVTLNEFCKVITRLIVVSDLNRTISA
jgi:hypothetical protein